MGSLQSPTANSTAIKSLSPQAGRNTVAESSATLSKALAKETAAGKRRGSASEFIRTARSWPRDRIRPFTPDQAKVRLAPFTPINCRFVLCLADPADHGIRRSSERGIFAQGRAAGQGCGLGAQSGGHGRKASRHGKGDAEGLRRRPRFG